MDASNSRSITHVFPGSLDLLHNVQLAVMEDDRNIPQMALGVCQAILTAWLQRPMEFELSVWLHEKREQACILHQSAMELSHGQSICHELQQAKSTLCEGLAPVDAFDSIAVFSDWVKSCWNIPQEQVATNCAHSTAEQKSEQIVLDKVDTLSMSPNTGSNDLDSGKSDVTLSNVCHMTDDVTDQPNKCTDGEDEITEMSQGVDQVNGDEILRETQGDVHEVIDKKDSNAEKSDAIGEPNDEDEDSVTMDTAMQSHVKFVPDKSLDTGNRAVKTNQAFYCIFCHDVSGMGEHAVNISRETFSTHHHLLIHIKQKHLQEKTKLRCPVCTGYESAVPRNVLRHVVRKHKLLYFFGVDCPFGSITQAVYDKSDEFVCLFCDPVGPLNDPQAETFSRISDLKSHIVATHIDKRDDEQLIPCPYCDCKVHTTVGNTARIVMSVLSHLSEKHKMIYWRKQQSTGSADPPGSEEKQVSKKRVSKDSIISYSNKRGTKPEKKLKFGEVDNNIYDMKGKLVSENTHIHNSRKKIKPVSTTSKKRSETNDEVIVKHHSAESTSAESFNSGPLMKKFKLACLHCGKVYSGDDHAGEISKHMCEAPKVGEDPQVSKTSADLNQAKSSLPYEETSFGKNEVMKDKSGDNTSEKSQNPNEGESVPCDSSGKAQKARTRRKIKCPQCSRMFSCVRFLKNHQQLHHPVSKQYLCGQCGKAFSHRRSLIAHSWTKHKINLGGQEVETCDICGSQELHYAMQKHRKNHDRRSPRNCAICDHHCETSVEYRQHLTTHMVDQDICCPHCCFRQKKLSLVLKHINSKHKNKDYKCALCPYVAIAQDGLAKHIAKVHPTGHRSCYCYDCSRPFASAQAYENHMFLKHGENVSNRRVIPCPLCPYVVVHRCKLDKHLQNHHQQSMKCPVCLTPQNNEVEYRQHLKTHMVDQEFHCPHCSFRNDLLSSLVTHLHLKHRNKKYKCALCRYVSVAWEDLTKHIASAHVSEHRPYYCYQCFSPFANAQVYENHMFLQHGENVSNHRVITCPLCPYAVVHSRFMEEHVRIHYHQDSLNAHIPGTSCPDVTAVRDECGLKCETSEARVENHKHQSHALTSSNKSAVNDSRRGDVVDEDPDAAIMVVLESAEATHVASEQKISMEGVASQQINVEGFASQQINVEGNASQQMYIRYACQMCSFEAASVSLVSSHLVEIHGFSADDPLALIENEPETIVED